MKKTKLTIKWTSQFKKDYKTAEKRGLKLQLLHEVIAQLANGKTLPAQYRDHPLTGNWANFRECHIRPDWLLVYHLDGDVLVLTLTRTGSHSDIFK